MATKKKKKSGKALWILLFIIAALLGAAYFLKSTGKVGAKKLTKVSAEKARLRQIIETVSASGKVYPEQEVKISPDVSGEIIGLYVEEGDSVTAGQLLVKIDGELYQPMIDRAVAAANSSKANMASSKARLLQMKANMDNVRNNVSRNQTLFDQGIIPAVELENLKASLITAEAEYQAGLKSIEAAEYNVRSAEASVKEAKDNVGKTEIYAPKSGVVSLLAVEQGERVVGTSQMSGTEMLRIADFSKLETRVEVSENDVVKVAVTDTVDVEADAYPSETFKGVVTKITNPSTSGVGGMAGISTDQVTNYTVRVRLIPESYKQLYKDKPKGYLPFRPGMSVSVEIRTENKLDILTIPIQSVTTREDTINEDSDELNEVVFVVNDENKIEERKIKTGIQDNAVIEVLSGIREKEQIVTGPYRAISRTLEHDLEVEVVAEDKLFENKNDKE